MGAKLSPVAPTIKRYCAIHCNAPTTGNPSLRVLMLSLRPLGSAFTRAEMTKRTEWSALFVKGALSGPLSGQEQSLEDQCFAAALASNELEPFALTLPFDFFTLALLSVEAFDS